MNEMYEKTGSTDEPDRGFMLHACMPRGMLNEFQFPAKFNEIPAKFNEIPAKFKI